MGPIKGLLRPNDLATFEPRTPLFGHLRSLLLSQPLEARLVHRCRHHPTLDAAERAVCGPALG
eukprot:3273266-Prymnesium_polylepis.1